MTSAPKEGMSTAFLAGRGSSVPQSFLKPFDRSPAAVLSVRSHSGLILSACYRPVYVFNRRLARSSIKLCHNSVLIREQFVASIGPQPVFSMVRS